MWVSATGRRFTSPRLFVLLLGAGPGGGSRAMHETSMGGAKVSRRVSNSGSSAAGCRHPARTHTARFGNRERSPPPRQASHRTRLASPSAPWPWLIGLGNLVAGHLTPLSSSGVCNPPFPPSYHKRETLGEGEETLYGSNKTSRGTGRRATPGSPRTASGSRHHPSLRPAPHGFRDEEGGFLCAAFCCSRSCVTHRAARPVRPERGRA
jgi:hypothetical protein